MIARLIVIAITLTALNFTLQAATGRRRWDIATERSIYQIGTLVVVYFTAP